MTLNNNPTAEHHLIASLIRTIRQITIKHPQNGNSKEMKRSLGSGGAAVFTICSYSCPAHGNVLQLGGRTLQGIVENADSRLCTLYKQIRRAGDNGKNGLVQLRWSGNRSRAEFRYMKCTYLTPRRNLIPEHRQVSSEAESEQWETQKLSSKWKSCQTQMEWKQRLVILRTNKL